MTKVLQNIALFSLFAMLFFSSFGYLEVNGTLTENGTCISDNITKGNETTTLNQTTVQYFKNLTSDNRVMAEMMCHSFLNETIAK